uniref:Bifunctional inhibitor/plant lipid transfer protein/seed storage helical domain-containing protein n=1 Tax=Oryza meridionalis TaxID=40149 RepID=A0A0E0DPK1_9ORYZ
MRCSGRLAVSLLLLLLSGSRLAAAGRGAAGPVVAFAADADAVAGAPGGGGSFPADPLLPCMEELLPCTAYLGSGRSPSHTCCTALHDGAVDEMQCLCRLLADPELLRTFNVTRDQMFRLPSRCGLPVGCHAGAAGSPEPVVEAPPPPPDETEDQQAGGDDSSGGGDRRRGSASAGQRVIAAVALGGAASVAALLHCQCLPLPVMSYSG